MDLSKFPTEEFLSNLVEARRTSCDAFLKGRDTNRAKLAETARKSFGEDSRVLITSSPVHGLANSTSDIDLICIVKNDDFDIAQAAQQMYDGANHLEAIGFLEEDLFRAFSELADWSAQPLNQGAELFAGSQSKAIIRSKYLERIINGIDADSGVAPYIDHLRPLSAIWATLGIGRAVKLATLSQMAASAAWDRAARAFALDALLQGMDATLSAHGWVCSNSKWFLPRWRMSSTDFHVGAASEEWPHWIDAAWEEVRANRQDAKTLAVTMTQMIENASAFFGEDLLSLWAWQVDGNVVGKRELGGLECSIHIERNQAIGFAPPDRSQLSLSDARSLSDDQAVRWLHFSRAGFARFAPTVNGDGR